MRRVSLFLTTIVSTALLLAACGGQETSTSVPSTNVPPVTVESTMTGEESATEAPTSASDMTSTPSVPVTGDNSPSRVSNLIGTSVCGMGGDQLGTVQDLVVDFDQTMVTYVIVDANGRNIAVPWTSFDMDSVSGMGTGTGSGTGTALETSTPGTGTGLETSTPEAGATAAATSSSDTGTGTGTGLSANCLAITADNDTFTNAPDFDSSTLPAQGQSAAGWDTSMSGYWANPGAGSGETDTGTGSETSTPSAGDTSATAAPSTEASAGTSTDTGTATATGSDSGTGTGTGTGTGNGLGQGAMQMQGVMMATDIMGATVTVSPQGNEQGTGSGNGTGTGTGTGSETSTPEAGATAAATSTTDSGTGTGTGTGDFSTGTVEDMIIEPQTGDVQYLVVNFGTEARWFPIPVGFLRWDSTMTGFVLMINQNALQNAPAFTSDQFPDTSSSGWDQEFSTFWQSNGGTDAGTGSGTGGVSISTATATP